MVAAPVQEVLRQAGGAARLLTAACRLWQKNAVNEIPRDCEGLWGFGSL